MGFFASEPPSIISLKKQDSEFQIYSAIDL